MAPSLGNTRRPSGMVNMTEIPDDKTFDAYALQNIIHNYIYDQTRRGEVDRPKLTSKQIEIILEMAQDT